MKKGIMNGIENYIPKGEPKEKNRIRPEYFKNFTNYVEYRQITIEKSDDINENYFNNLFAMVTSKANLIIQDLNIKIPTRQLPYIMLTPVFERKLFSNSRFTLRWFGRDNTFQQDIIDEFDEVGEDISHMIDVLVAEGYNDITISSDCFDAKMIVDSDNISCVLIDVLLDIIMFNSYSFLKDLDIPHKREFSFRKTNFFIENKLPCFYDYESKAKIKNSKYYSIAFSARKNHDDIDIDKYISYWNNLINKYYLQCKHHEMSIEKQIDFHVDEGELPKNQLYKEFSQKNKGAYLILRTNRDRSEELQDWICSLFGLDYYKKGEVKIVKIDEYENLKKLFEKLDVSVFKIVKQ